MFQSTPPRGGRRVFFGFFRVARNRFNPRPRAGGDILLTDVRNLAKAVSIHAPARGATILGGEYWADVKVSIHAPARGATGVLEPSPYFMLFQSTPPRGGRLHVVGLTTRFKSRFNPRPRAGGDMLQACCLMLTICFNPRPRAGGDTQSDTDVYSVIKFQSTPPRGGRLAE